MKPPVKPKYVEKFVEQLTAAYDGSWLEIDQFITWVGKKTLLAIRTGKDISSEWEDGGWRPGDTFVGVVSMITFRDRGKGIQLHPAPNKRLDEDQCVKLLHDHLCWRISLLPEKEQQQYQ